MKRVLSILLLTLLLLGALALALGTRANEDQLAIVAGARSCLGDIYDSSECPGGPPPDGRGACTDVVYYALQPDLDLQQEVNADVELAPSLYPGTANPNLDYRWCPKLILWFGRHSQVLPLEDDRPALLRFRPGDVVFYDDGMNAGVPGHVGVVSDKISWDGIPLLIHNPAPVCVEENALFSNQIVGHFRLAE